MVMNVRSRILLTFLFLSFISMVLTGGLVYWVITERLETRLLETQKSHLRLLSSLLGETTVDGPGAAARLTVFHNIARDLNSRVTLIRRDGSVAFDSGISSDSLSFLENHATLPEILEAEKRTVGVARRMSQSTHRELSYAAMKVDHSPFFGQEYGFVRIATSVDDITRVRGEIAGLLAGSLTVVGIVTLLVSFWVSRRVSRPLLEIVSVVNRIRNGDVNARIIGTHPAEIGELATAVNNMAEKLADDRTTLDRLERVRNEFLGNVSHELRTPIFSLQGFLETLLDGAIDDPGVNREFLEKAYRHAERLNVLLSDLIEISRIQSGEMKMSFRYFSVREFLEAIVEEMKPAADTKGIRLSLALEFDTAAKVYGDRTRLRQVMTNLIDNALKYTEPGGLVTCSARPVKNQCEILVTDTGCGIAEEHLPRIFERFYRVDRDRSREVGGTGLGLAIVKHIIEAHGGSIKVASRVGSGSTFSFTLKR
jgi:two-component system phosphate regulon sensor histidine kinase PhoR